MKNVYRCLALATVAASLAACASAPEDIKPANFDAKQISYLTCPQLSEYKGALTAAYQQAADKEDTARAMDAVGLLVLGMPVGSMKHKYTPGQIADLKGRLAAVNQLEVAGNCQQQQVASSDMK